MYGRRRGGGPGNGYRPNMLGMSSMAPASRISPEGSIRGHQMYNTEYRNYNRSGYGRGGGGGGGGSHSKPFQPPMPPPREIDIFMEAGRLAAEYLVSKGVLPPNALSGKWQYGEWKKQMGDFVQSPMESRVSVHSRLGTATVDVGPGRRRYSDDSMGSKSSFRGRRGSGSYDNNRSDWNRERSGSCSDKGRASPGKEAVNDISAGRKDEQPVKKDSGAAMQDSSAGTLTQEIDNVTDCQLDFEKSNIADDGGAKQGFSSNEKDVPSNDDVGTPIKESDGSTISDEEIEKAKDGRNDNEIEKGKEERNDNDLEKKDAENMEVTAPPQEEGSLVSNASVDLTSYCKFANVPTKTRSSLASRGPKVELHHIADDDTVNESKLLEDSELPEDSDVEVLDAPVDGSPLNASSQQTQEPNSLSDIPKALEDRVGVAYSVGTELPGLENSNAMFFTRGEKRPLDSDIDGRNETKRPREFVPLMETQSDIKEEPTSSHTDHATLFTDNKSLDISPFGKSHVESSEYTEEKQLFPGSFKTCDLNLMETSEVNENHVADPILMFRSITESGRQATPVDIDLSINSNNSNALNKYGKRGIIDKDIEVIDLEDDSMQEDKTFTNADRRADSVFNGLDSFPDNVHNASEIPDQQDGYGLMISELLGNDSVPTDLNALHNDMGLHNGQGILGDDDSIYMSLGEIPISFLSRSWEQPTQEYGKPF